MTRPPVFLRAGLYMNEQSADVLTFFILELRSVGHLGECDVRRATLPQGAAVMFALRQNSHIPENSRAAEVVQHALTESGHRNLVPMTTHARLGVLPSLNRQPPSAPAA